MRSSRGRRIGLMALIIIVAALIVAIGVLIWYATPPGELMPQVYAALESDESVVVSRGRWIEFAPRAGSPRVGFIMYPGGRVLAEAYAPLARGLAEAGYLAIVPSMPLNLAILDYAAADAIMDAHADIERWVIGGHSLGGVMAARYAYHHPRRVQGLVLMAAYPEASLDLSGSGLRVATIYAELDGLASMDEIESSFALLPPNARKALIMGGNHAQFGWYGAQDGDKEAKISREAQQEQTLAAALAILRRAGQ